MKKIIFTMLLAASCIHNAYADTQVGRYLTVGNDVSLAQSDPLQQTFQLVFPDSVNRVGDAINFLLVNTGYTLASQGSQSATVIELLQQPLPLSVRALGPTTVQAGLLALAGNAFQLVVDPAHRLVSFRLRQQYQSIYRGTW